MVSLSVLYDASVESIIVLGVKFLAGICLFYTTRRCEKYQCADWHAASLSVDHLDEGAVAQNEDFAMKGS